MVVVRRTAARINHGVDRRRSSERSATRLVAAPPVEAALWHGLEGPIVETPWNHQDAGERYLDDPAIARAAGFQQADGDARILAQPARDDATGRTGTQYQIVEFIHRAPSNDPAQQTKELIKCPAVRRQQQIDPAQPRSIENRLFLAESAKAPFAVIAARAGGADAAEWLALLTNVHETIVHSHAARYGLLQHPPARLAVCSEPIQRQWPLARIDEGDCLLAVSVRDNRQDRPEDLFATDQHVVVRRKDQGWRKLPPRFPFLRLVGSSLDPRALDRGVVNNRLQPLVVGGINDRSIIGVARF